MNFELTQIENVSGWTAVGVVGGVALVALACD